MDGYYSTYDDELSRVFDSSVTDADFDFYNTTAAASSSSTNPAYSLNQSSTTPYATLSLSISGPGHVSVAASTGHSQGAPGPMAHLHTVQPQLQRHDSGLYNSQTAQLPLLQQQQQQQQHHQLRQNEAASVHASNHPTRAQQSGTDGNHPRAQQQLQHHDTADVTLHQQRAQQQVQDMANFGAGPRPAAGYGQQQEVPIQQQQRFSPTQQQHQLTQSQYHNSAAAHGQYISAQYQQAQPQQQQHHTIVASYPSASHTTASYVPAPSIPSHQQQHPQVTHAQRSPVAEPHGQGQGPGIAPNGYGASVPAASSAQQQQAEPARRSNQTYLYSAMLHQQQQQRLQMAQQQPMGVSVATQQVQTPAGGFATPQQHPQGQMFAQPSGYQPLQVQIPSQHSPTQYSATSQMQSLHQQAMQRRASYEQQVSPQSASHPRVPSQYQYAQAMTPNSRRSSFTQPDVKDQPFTQHLQNYASPQQQQQQPQRQSQQQYVSPSTYATHAHVYEQQQQQQQQQQRQQQQQQQQQRMPDYAYEHSPSYSLGGAMDFPAATRIVSGSTTGSSTSTTEASPSIAASTSPTIANTASPQTMTLVDALIKPEPMAMEMPLNHSVPLSANGDIKPSMVYASAGGMYYTVRPQVAPLTSAAPSEFTLKSEHSRDHAMTKSVMMTTSDPPPFNRAWAAETKPPTPPPASPQLESGVEQSAEQQSPAEVYYSPPCHSTRSKRRSSTNVNSTAPVAKKVKMSPDAGETPVASTSASAAGAYAMQGIEDAGGVPEDDEEDADGDGEAGEAMDGEWTASGANEPKSRPPPRNRHSSGSSAKTTVAKVKSSANLAALAKLSEDERKYVLIADPFSGAVEANRVFCTECQKWVKLGEGVRFRVRHWAGHCALVHKRTRQESEAIHEQGARNATSAALAPPAPPPTAPVGAGLAGGSSKSSKAKRPKTKSKQSGGGGAARNRAQSDSDDDQPLAILTQRQKPRPTKVGQSPNRMAAESGSTTNAARDDSPLTPMSSPIAPSQSNGRVTHMQASTRAPVTAFSAPDVSQYHHSTFGQRALHTYDNNEDAVGSPDF